MLKAWLDDLGLRSCRPFFGDRDFFLALLLGMVFWLGVWLFAPQLFPSLPRPGKATLLLSLIVWQPLLEEMLFRGVIQGQLKEAHWGKATGLGISYANLLTSTLFALSHLLYHTPLWALAVFVPSLIFGHLRDRYDSIYPAMLVHIFYNAGYFLLGEFI